MRPARPGRPSRTASTSSPATAGTARSTRSPTRSWRRPSGPGAQTPMGILPGGTGNGFAREMGVPETPARGHRGPVHQHDDPRRRRRPAPRPRAGGRRRPLLRPAAVRRASSPRSRRAASSRTGTACSAYLVNADPACARHDGRPLPRRTGRRDVRVRGVEGLRHQLRDDGDRASRSPRRMRSTTGCSTAS